MNIAIAIDSFKGSLTSMEAGRACMDGIKRVFPQSQVKIFPIADGGEGTVDALTEGMGGKTECIRVTGPLGQKVDATYGIIPTTSTAVIEMSAASGITLVPEKDRNPLYTTTYGVGEIIAHAIGKGCRSFIVGIGGSATNDGGVGMLQALGFSFTDENGNDIPKGASGLEKLCSIDASNALAELSECSFSIACDVKNPLCGNDGCSAVYGPQKGADPEMIEKMDKWLLSYAKLAKESFPHADENFPGSGAAGGMGFAFRTFLGGELKNGINMILAETGIEEYIKSSDYVITGEGRLDSQTVMGKAPAGVAAIAKKYSKPVIAFSGSVTADAGVCNSHGIDAFFPVLRRITTLEEAMEKSQAAKNMADTAEQVFRTLRINMK